MHKSIYHKNIGFYKDQFGQCNFLREYLYSLIYFGYFMRRFQYAAHYQNGKNMEYQ